MAKETPFNTGNKFVSLGGAFTTHTDSDRPKKWPDVWVVPAEGIINDGVHIKIPPEVENVTIGPELTAVVGEPMWRVDEGDVEDAIAGFTVSTDITAKSEWPGYANKNHPHITGTGYKIFPTFRPVLSTYKCLNINNVSNLHVEAISDGTTIVDGSTAELKFSIAKIFAHVSKIIKLNPGDMVALGDPGNPDEYIDNASSVTSRIENVGEITNPVRNLAEE
jgi:2-keto-4-pentenoate hydratase/2-oxohepta-3-ene-1,7-dioic acid hydratase in catechol pathway